MPSVGWPELIIILVVALLLFGPQRMAGIGGALGRAIRDFRHAVRETDDDLKKLTSPEDRNRDPMPGGRKIPGPPDESR
jgi:sec-independent protein translocase protein TatA